MPDAPSQDAVLNLLRNMLASEDEHTRWHGVRFVGEWAVNELVPEVLKLLGVPARDLGDTDVRRVAAWSLGKLGYDLFADQIDSFSRDENPLAREGIADALGEALDPRGVPTLKRLVQDQNRDVALWASLGLAKIGAPAIPALRDLLLAEDLDLSRAMYALDALRKLALPEAESIIEEYLGKTRYEELRRDRSWLEKRPIARRPT